MPDSTTGSAPDQPAASLVQAAKLRGSEDAAACAVVRWQPETASGEGQP